MRPLLRCGLFSTQTHIFSLSILFFVIRFPYETFPQIKCTVLVAQIGTYLGLRLQGVCDSLLIDLLHLL
jgi:hypothetical protein